MTKKGDWPAPEMTTRWDAWAPNPNQMRWLPFKLPAEDEVRLVWRSTLFFVF